MLDLEEEFEEGSLLSAIIGIERIIEVTPRDTIRIGKAMSLDIHGTQHKIIIIGTAMSLDMQGMKERDIIRICKVTSIDTQGMKAVFILEMMQTLVIVCILMRTF